MPVLTDKSDSVLVTHLVRKIPSKVSALGIKMSGHTHNKWFTRRLVSIFTVRIKYILLLFKNYITKDWGLTYHAYSGKVWWGKSLAKLTNLAKLQVICQLKPAKPARRPVNHRHSPNFFSPKLLDAQFAKVFPHQTFPLYDRFKLARILTLYVLLHVP